MRVIVERLIELVGSLQVNDFPVFPLAVFSDAAEKPKLAVVGSPYWMAPEVLRGERYNEKVDVFAYGIILCEIIGRIQADPDFLPRTEDFGLDVEAFRQMVGDCPPHFFKVTFICCSVRPLIYYRSSSNTTPLSRKHSLNIPADPRLCRSKSDVLLPLSPFLTGTTPMRVNPFSQRQDLNGGRIKLFDTPSKSVISLTFALPPPPDPSSPVSCDKGPLHFHRRSQSLPSDDSGLPLNLELMSPTRLDESIEDPMDCTNSPDTLDSAVATSIKTFSNGWSSPVSNEPPSLHPLLDMDNNNGTIPINQSLGWGVINSNGATTPFMPPEQEEVIACPGCCLAGMSFPSICTRGPRQTPYKNLNGDAAAKRLLCKALPPSPTEPNIALPSTQT
uniref:Dual specificity testis-specific protein kinase 1-like n=1 Tax=Sinocyclocheilus rhinocerous TaxID=307959 RepID=A0A673JKW8_9TELE